MTSDKLQIGLIINGQNVPNWIFHIVQRIVQSDSSKIVVVINTKSKSKIKSKNPIFNKFIDFDRKAYKVEKDATEVRSLPSIKEISDIQSITLSEQEQPTSLEITRIKNLNLDVFLKFDATSCIDRFKKLAKYGVWYHYVGDYPIQLPILYGVQEFLEKQEVTKITLSAWINNSSEEFKLFESYSRTDNHSIYRSLNNTYWKAVSFMPRKLNELFKLGPDTFFNKVQCINSGSDETRNKPFRTPNGLKLSIYLFNYFASKLRNKISELRYFDQWILLFKLSDTQGISNKFSEFERLLPPKDRFWGDPFVLFKNESYYIFFEELIYKKNKGTIVVLEINQQGQYQQPRPVLETDYHLSYPFILEDNGKLFMLPETKGNRTIELYECIDFPLKWKLKEILFHNIRAVDSTILRYNEKYWLFTNIQENEGTFTSDDELFLFYSDSLLNGNWTPHPQNPIVSDVRYARPAGKIFEQNGRLYRPAQNCAKHYGHGMQIHEIITLNEKTYKEIKVQAIFPDWDKDMISTHTLNHDNKITFMDAKIKRRKA